MFNVLPSSMKCSQYRVNGIEIDTGVIIGPVRIFEEERPDGVRVYDLVIGCSKFYYCENESCAYSHASRMGRKKEGQVTT